MTSKQEIAVNGAETGAEALTDTEIAALVKERQAARLAALRADLAALLSKYGGEIVGIPSLTADGRITVDVILRLQEATR